MDNGRIRIEIRLKTPMDVFASRIGGVGLDLCKFTHEIYLERVDENEDGARLTRAAGSNGPIAALATATEAHEKGEQN